MARQGNKSSGQDVGAKGPCTSCKSTMGPFKPVRSHEPTGRSRMVQYCKDCLK
jgi:hypothetical protein